MGGCLQRHVGNTFGHPQTAPGIAQSSLNDVYRCLDGDLHVSFAANLRIDLHQVDSVQSVRSIEFFHEMYRLPEREPSADYGRDLSVVVCYSFSRMVRYLDFAYLEFQCSVLPADPTSRCRNLRAGISNCMDLSCLVPCLSHRGYLDNGVLTDQSSMMYND